MGNYGLGSTSPTFLAPSSCWKAPPDSTVRSVAGRGVDGLDLRDWDSGFGGIPNPKPDGRQLIFRCERHSNNSEAASRLGRSVDLVSQLTILKKSFLQAVDI